MLLLLLLLLQGRGLTITDVARATRRLRLYRQLRQMDPLGFLLLCRADTTRVFDTQAWARGEKQVPFLYLAGLLLGCRVWRRTGGQRVHEQGPWSGRTPLLSVVSPGLKGVCDVVARGRDH